MCISACSTAINKCPSHKISTPFWKTWCTTALITYYTTERKIKAKDGECYQLRGFVLQSRVVNKGFFKKINI